MSSRRYHLVSLLLLVLALVAWFGRSEIGVQGLALHSWLSELGDSTLEERLARLDRIAATGDRSQIPWVVEVAYHDPSWKPRKAAEVALAAIEGEKATPVLVDMLLHAPLWRDRVKPAELLGKVGNRTCVPALIQQLGDPDYIVRYWCAKSLGVFREPTAVPPLLRLLRDDPEDYPRAGAAFALGEIGDRSAVPYLLHALQDPHPHVRAHAVQALGKLGDRIAAPVVMLLSRDPDEEVRKQVCRTLGLLGDPMARPALEQMRQDPSPQVAFLARRGLDTLAGAGEPGFSPPKGRGRQVRDF